VTRPLSQAYKELILSLYEKLGYKDWELELVRKTLECVDVTCAAARVEADKRIEQAKQKSEAGTQSQSSGGNASDGASKTPRVSSKSLRNKWEAETGQKWPKDPNTGRNHDVAHKKPLSEGGSNKVENIEPLPREEHMRQHSEAGDFKRWGAQGAQKKAGTK
jgi:hypothetical protein